MSVLTYLELKSDIRGIVSCWAVVKQFFFFFKSCYSTHFGHLEFVYWEGSVVLVQSERPQVQPILTDTVPCPLGLGSRRLYAGAKIPRDWQKPVSCG